MPDLQAGRSLKIALVLSIALLLGSLALQVWNRGSGSSGDAELRAVQAAVINLMVENGVRLLPNPVKDPTGDMGGFPDAVTPPEMKGLTGGDKPGYVLFGHDMVADGSAFGPVNYVSARLTTWTYTVTPGGMVYQGPKNRE